MMGKLMANQGFNAFRGLAKSFMGWGALKGVGRQAAAGNLEGAGRRAMGWLTASGFQGGKRIGAAGARGLGLGTAVSASADFLNPWGLGWGD